MTKTKKTQPVDLQNLGSLITYDDNGVPRCLGYLMDFKEKGIYDPSLGKLDVTKEHADAHNSALDIASLEGLDNSCEIGQGTDFYVRLETQDVHTWIGTIVQDGKITVGEKNKRGMLKIQFTRKNRKFEGMLNTKDPDQTIAFFIRVA